MKLIFAVFLFTSLTEGIFGSPQIGDFQTRCQSSQNDRTDLVQGSLPTYSEIDKMLSDSNAIERMVSCLIADVFDCANCDSRLERAHALATEYLVRGGADGCVSCTTNENSIVQYFMSQFSKRYRKQYNKLNTGILERANNEAAF